MAAVGALEKRDKLLGKKEQDEDIDILEITDQEQRKQYFARLEKSISDFMKYIQKEKTADSSEENKEDKTEERTVQTPETTISVPINHDEENKVKQIKFGKFIILSLVTCGIYSIYALYRFNENVNILCEGDGKKSKNYIVVILLGLVTCGIYTFYWMYKQAERMREIAPRYRCNINTKGTKVLLWGTFGTLIFIGPAIAWYDMLKSMNQLAEQYNQGNIDEGFMIPQNKIRAGKPTAIIAGFYIFLIILYASLFSLLFSLLFGGVEEDTGNYGNQYYEDYSFENQQPYGEEGFYEYGAGYELVTTEQLSRNPDSYIGQPVKLECDFIVLLDEVVVSSESGYIKIQCDKQAYDEFGNKLGQILSGDSGYVEGTFSRYEDSLGYMQSMITADRVVVTSEEVADSYSGTYGQAGTSNPIFGVYENQYGESLTIFEEEGFDDNGNFYEAKVQGTNLDGQVWEACIVSLTGDPLQVTTLGGKVIAQISPGDDEIAVEWRSDMGNYEWYKKAY